MSIHELKSCIYDIFENSHLLRLNNKQIWGFTIMMQIIHIQCMNEWIPWLISHTIFWVLIVPTLIPSESTVIGLGYASVLEVVFKLRQSLQLFNLSSVHNVPWPVLSTSVFKVLDFSSFGRYLVFNDNLSSSLYPFIVIYSAYNIPMYNLKLAIWYQAKQKNCDSVRR
jgi:hypothetical protein